MSASRRTDAASRIKMTLRGCGTLPHVGPHPGTCFVSLLIAVGALMGGYFGAAMMALVMLPLYLIGAYERSKASESLEAFWPHKRADDASRPA